MRGVKLFVIVVLLWALPLVAAGQETAGSETEGQKLMVKVTPSDKGCSVALSTNSRGVLCTACGRRRRPGAYLSIAPTISISPLCD